MSHGLGWGISRVDCLLFWFKKKKDEEIVVTAEDIYEYNGIRQGRD